MRKIQNISSAKLPEALQHLSDSSTSMPVGGGSDLLALLKTDLVTPDTLVDLKSVQGMSGISVGSQEIAIGAATTLNDISSHSRIQRDYSVLAEAAGSVATPQIRNTGTLGGNLCQRPWCWYFRQGFPCFKHGGDRCFSAAGENQYNAIFGGAPSFIVHPSDTAPALVALGAQFQITGSNGERTVAASDFFVLPRERILQENILEPGEILTEVRLPASPGPSRYAKLMDRKAWTHAVISLASVLKMDGSIVADARLVLGGVAPIPWRLPEVESFLKGKRLTTELATQAGQRATQGATPLAKNGYKIPLLRSLVKREIIAYRA